MNENNPRDYIGYGRDNVPDANWPNKAKIAVQFVLNYEEGGENCVLHGDPHSETFLSEIAGAEAYPERHMSMESLMNMAPAQVFGVFLMNLKNVKFR